MGPERFTLSAFREVAVIRHILVAIIASILLTSCGGDPEQYKSCTSLIPWLERGSGEYQILAKDRLLDQSNAVRLTYQNLDRAPGDRQELWVNCEYQGGYFQQGRLQLVSVESSRDGVLDDIQVAMLNVLLPRLNYQQGGAIFAFQPDYFTQTSTPALYVAQQLLNALVLGAIYALIALGYTLIYSMVGRINLAFGEFAMVGSYITLIAVALIAGGTQGLPLPLMLGIPLVVALAIGMAFGVASESLVFRPLHRVQSHAPLIASIGVAILIQEYVRLSQGGGEQSLQPVLNSRFVLASNSYFDVGITAAQLLIILVSLIVFVFLSNYVRQSRGGRMYRACAQDPRMAALLGVDVRLMITLTFAVAGAIASLGGYISALYYGSVTFYMGTLIGFKALVAAVIGGIGSIRGAFAGAFIIAILETFWVAYQTAVYKDVGVFILLILFLVMRPQGVFGVIPRKL